MLNLLMPKKKEKFLTLNHLVGRYEGAIYSGVHDPCVGEEYGTIFYNPGEDHKIEIGTKGGFLYIKDDKEPNLKLCPVSEKFLSNYFQKRAFWHRGEIQTTRSDQLWGSDLRKFLELIRKGTLDPKDGGGAITYKGDTIYEMDYHSALDFTGCKTHQLSDLDKEILWKEFWRRVNWDRD